MEAVLRELFGEQEYIQLILIYGQLQNIWGICLEHLLKFLGQDYQDLSELLKMEWQLQIMEIMGQLTIFIKVFSIQGRIHNHSIFRLKIYKPKLKL